MNVDGLAKTPGTSVLSTDMYAYCENNPVNCSDSTRQWVGLDDLIAGAVGAVVGLGSQLVSDVVTSAVSGSWQFPSWQTYVGAGSRISRRLRLGIALVAADDATGIGVADDFLFGPLGAGAGKGLIMIFG